VRLLPSPTAPGELERLGGGVVRERCARASILDFRAPLWGEIDTLGPSMFADPVRILEQDVL